MPGERQTHTCRSPSAGGSSRGGRFAVGVLLTACGARTDLSLPEPETLESTLVPIEAGGSSSDREPSSRGRRVNGETGDPMGPPRAIAEEPSPPNTPPQVSPDPGPIVPPPTLPMEPLPMETPPAVPPTPVPPAMQPMEGPPPAVPTPGVPEPPLQPTPPPEGMPPTVSECNETEGAVQSNDTAALAGVQSIYSYGDGATTICVDANEPGQICVTGYAADAGPEYQNWGAAVGLQLAVEQASGELSPLDASASGAVAVEFVLAVGGPEVQLRAQFTMVDDPSIATQENNYEFNSFLYEGSPSNDLQSGGAYQFPLSRFAAPEWTNLDSDQDGAPDEGELLDPTRLHSLSIQVVTQPGTEGPYAFCVSELRWVAADGTTVPLTVPEVR